MHTAHYMAKECMRNAHPLYWMILLHNFFYRYCYGAETTCCDEEWEKNDDYDGFTAAVRIRCHLVYKEISLLIFWIHNKFHAPTTTRTLKKPKIRFNSTIRNCLQNRNLRNGKYNIKMFKAFICPNFPLICLHFTFIYHIIFPCFIGLCED